jgi:hypothetical protein
MALYWASGAQEYVIRYQPLTSGTQFLVETKKGERVGKVVRAKNKESVLYSFLDPVDRLLASGTAERQPPGTSLCLLDIGGSPIGYFSAEILNLYPREYKVFTKEKRLCAKGAMNWLGSSFVLSDPDNPKRHITSYFRPRFKLFNDNWHFDTHEEGVIDLRLLCVIGAFQTACDLNFEMIEPKVDHY